MTRVALAAVLAVTLPIGSSCGNPQESKPVLPRFAAGETDDTGRRAAVPPARSDSVLSIRIVPEIAQVGTPLRLIATGFSPRDEAVIEWKVNGELAAGQQGESFPTEGLRKGTSVQARVKVGEREATSSPVTLANGPPEIRSVRIVPEIIRPGDSIAVEVSGSDPDGDEVAFEYRWEKNGQPAGTGSRLEGTLRRGDAISVRITPFDGEARGNFLIVRREVLNFPPEIRGVIGARMADGLYTCRVEATDGDDDPLTYTLAKAPPEMTIDTATGAIRWSVPDRFHGEVPVTVSITDGHGGEASYPMVLTIQEEERPKE